MQTFHRFRQLNALYNIHEITDTICIQVPAGVFYSHPPHHQQYSESWNHSNAFHSLIRCGLCVCVWKLPLLLVASAASFTHTHTHTRLHLNETKTRNGFIFLMASLLLLPSATSNYCHRSATHKDLK